MEEIKKNRMKKRRKKRDAKWKKKEMEGENRRPGWNRLVGGKQKRKLLTSPQPFGLQKNSKAAAWASFL